MNDPTGTQNRGSLSGGTTLGPKTERAKAKVDGEDLLTPLVQKVAEAVAAAL